METKFKVWRLERPAFDLPFELHPALVKAGRYLKYSTSKTEATGLNDGYRWLAYGQSSFRVFN